MRSHQIIPVRKIVSHIQGGATGCGGGSGWATLGVVFSMVVKVPMALQSLKAGSTALTRQK